jgi:signal peptidase II
MLVTADLATKHWARISPLTVHGPTEILPFLSLVLAYNPGITLGGIFGIAGSSALVTMVISAACVLLAVWLCLERRKKAKFLIALALAGALGNTIDRLANTMVTDFLQLRFGGTFTLVVNLADIWIVMSIIGLLLLGRRSG